MRGSRQTRRTFITRMGMAGLSVPLTGLLQQSVASARQTENMNQQKKLGIALVGLGNYATTQLAPALLQTKHCYLAGIVTGTAAKIPVWKEKYAIPDQNIYNYDNYESIRNNPDIDIVYVVLPNNMHAEYTIRAFEAGKHVICEKPMAITVEDCDRMLAAAQKAKRHLSIG